jgi:hypothetical protein
MNRKRTALAVAVERGKGRKQFCAFSARARFHTGWAQLGPTSKSAFAPLLGHGGHQNEKALANSSRGFCWASPTRNGAVTDAVLGAPRVDRPTSTGAGGSDPFWHCWRGTPTRDPLISLRRRGVLNLPLIHETV